jgi:SWI/SNF-related matrix-associated actin-dependent regulator 1 of chromatin subfamily A
MKTPFGLKYLPFQEEAIKYAEGREAVLFGDEMGLGKTVEAIGFLNSHPEIDSVLVVCPASLKINWSRELDKWLISPFVEITIINYDILHKLDMSRGYDVVIFDEIHYAKNKKSLRSKRCNRIQAKYRLGLTGTPILNHPIDIWHPLHLLDPIRWPVKSYKEFAIRYANAHFGRWGWDDKGSSNLGELSEILQSIMIRRLKVDVLKDLPPKRRQVIELPADGLPSWTIEKLRQARIHIMQIEETYAQDVKKLQKALGVAWQEMAGLRHEIGRYKVPMMLELIEDAIEGSGKAVIFCHHLDVITELAKGLSSYHPVVINGAKTATERQMAIDEFQTNPTCQVFIGQTIAAGVGITLTAASHVIICELDWTPGVMSQAEDRCHRIGQKESVLVQHLVLEGSLDAHMAKSLVRKQEIIEEALGGKTTWVSKTV